MLQVHLVLSRLPEVPSALFRIHIPSSGITQAPGACAPLSVRVRATCQRCARAHTHTKTRRASKQRPGSHSTSTTSTPRSLVPPPSAPSLCHLPLIPLSRAPLAPVTGTASYRLKSDALGHLHVHGAPIAGLQAGCGEEERPGGEEWQGDVPSLLTRAVMLFGAMSALLGPRERETASELARV